MCLKGSAGRRSSEVQELQEFRRAEFRRIKSSAATLHNIY
jgi:hypothetical protein